MPAIKAHRIWGALLLSVNNHGFQTLMRCIAVEDQGRMVRPWHHPVTNKE